MGYAGSTILAALLCAGAVLVTGTGIGLARGSAALAGGPTGSLAGVAGSASASNESGPTGHVLPSYPPLTAASPLVTVPDLPTTEAAPIERPTDQVPDLTTLPPDPPTASPLPAAAAPVEPAPAAEPVAPAPTPEIPAPPPPAPDAPVLAPYATVLGWHGADQVAYLTFDDGPGPYTGRVLDILAAAGVKATFCEIGQRVSETPALTARVAAEGHTLCNHSWDHYSPFDSLPPETLDQEIDLTQNAIQQAAGVVPRYLRAPEGRFGAPGGAVLQAGQRARTIPLGWGVDSLDWQKPGAATIVANVMSEVSPGAIILLHDGGGTDREESIAALPAIISSLQAAGYTLAAMPADPAG